MNKIVEMDSPEEFIEEIEKLQKGMQNRIVADPKNVEKGLARLVLTLIELIRKLLEKQAIKRVEAGSLDEGEVERIGETLVKLENKMKELKQVFGLKEEDLNLNLGPLGDLM